MTYSGQSLKRVEDFRLLTGRSSFVDDITLPGLLHALVLRSPHAHARIRSIDVTGAQSLPGVAAVLTAKDIEGVISDPPARRAQEGYSSLAPEHPVLAKDKVFYVGQPVAVVVAVDERQAGEALELIQVDYEALPAIVDPLDAIAQDAPIIHDEMDTNVAMRVVHTGGDPDAAFAQADHVVRQQYRVQRLAPAPMEPRGLVADYQPRDDMLTIWDSTQHPHSIKARLAHLLNRPEDKLRVIAPDVGGGFGEKGSLFPEEIAVPYLSILLERPIKWVEDREENMLAFHGRGHTVDMEVAAKSDGTILGMKVSIVSDMGSFFMAATTTVPLLTSYRLVGPYRTPAAHVELQGVLTNMPRTGPYRGAGGPEAAFCMERTIDLIARDLGLNPADVRRRNFIPPESFPYDTPTGLTYDSGNYSQALDRGLELADYSGWRERSRRETGPGEPLIGVGLATVVKGTGGRGAILTDHARVIIEPSGRVTIHTGVSPHGQGTETTFAQLAADELGVTPADVRVLHGDTDALPAGGGTSASRGLVAGGSAMHYPLQDIRQKLNLIASHLLECPKEDVVLKEGRVFDRNNPAQEIPFSHVAAAAHSEELLPPGVTPGLDITASHTVPLSPYSFGAHVAVVEVSPDNGAVKILKYVAVHDAGRIINPMLAEGQVQGAVAQGIGQALMEGMAYSPEGQPLTATLMDYALPHAQGVPEMTLETVETPSPLNPLGSKGIGELPTVAAPVAVANAVMDALSGVGIRHIDTPLTPEKIWQALQGNS